MSAVTYCLKSTLGFLLSLHVADHVAELEDALSARNYTATHGECHLHIVRLLLSHADISSGSLDQILKLLVAELERQGLAIVEVLLLHRDWSVPTKWSINQNLSRSLLEKLHLGFTEIEHVFIALRLRRNELLLRILLLAIISL